MIKQQRLIWLLCLLLVISGCGSRPEAKLAPSQPGAKPAAASNSAMNGRAEAAQNVKAVSKLAGKVAAVTVDIGSEVKRGQVLFQLDARDLKASVDAARASLETAQIAYKYALTNQQRAQSLQASGAMSQADYDNNYVSALERSKAAVDLAQANLDKAQVSYTDCTITAPISGTVTTVNVKAGEYVSPQNTAVSIINLDQVQIKLFVDENRVNRLRPKQLCTVNVPAIPGQSFQGEITNISGAEDAVAKAYPVKVTVKNPLHIIKDGMFASVQL